MHFTRAIVRPPAPTFADGITSSNLGRPDLSLALQQHESYCRALERLGLTLDRLPPDSDFPDSTFVEDAAIVTERGAILTRPGASSRAGEVQAMSAALGRWFPQLDRITSPGTLDGGDVCEAGDHFFIGVSHRTNEEGATQLAGWLEQRGFGSSLIDIRGISGMLHHKTGISWLGGRRLLAWRGIAG
ncbi:MAG: arginine deiminase family protein, partial [Gemmatimonadales bacterium]